MAAVDAIAERRETGTPALRDQFQRIVGTSPGRHGRTFSRSVA
ncbi:MAG: hypothetical protein WAL04_14175 [Acidimicrobiales bacterium]